MTVDDLQDWLSQHPRSAEVNVNAAEVIDGTVTLRALGEPHELQEAIRLADERVRRQDARRKIKKL